MIFFSRMTLTDMLERSLKRGKGEEQMAAANLATLVGIQLGLSTSSEEVFNSLTNTLTALMLDPSQSAKARAAIATALGTFCFVASEPHDYKEVMENLEKVFKPSYNSSANFNPDTTSLHASALSAWSLLVTRISSQKALDILDTRMNGFSGLFASADVDLRIAAGEALVVLFENAYEADEDLAYDMVGEQLASLKELATDSHKYRSKKDRKEQKSTFRDILKYVEDGENFYEKVSVSHRETLEIVTWAQKRQYDALCKVTIQ